VRVVSGAVAQPVFDHLHRMTDRQGVFEYARHSDPQPDRGYCLDDISRALVVVGREPGPNPELQSLGRRLLGTTLSGLRPDGMCYRRMSSDGAWNGVAGVGDWWGRALWGLGVSAVLAPTPASRARALLGFRSAARHRSPHLRAMAFAALGAGELLAARPDELAARRLLLDVVAMLSEVTADPAWPWPEPRLTYSNATIAEALLVAGEALPDPAARSRGLHLLHFLLGIEVRDGHLSVTPVGGRGPSDLRPGFDQRPAEAAAIGAACAQAYESTDDPHWLDGLEMSWAWFLGDNDAETPMFDQSTGAGYDELQQAGRSPDQGAESTLAALSTIQHVRRLVPLVGP
jgi:hypothetical protein